MKEKSLTSTFSTKSDDLAPFLSSMEIELDLPPKRHRHRPGCSNVCWLCGKYSTSILLSSVIVIPFLIKFLFHARGQVVCLPSSSTICCESEFNQTFFAKLLEDMRAKEDHDVGFCEDSLVRENIVMFLVLLLHSNRLLFAHYDCGHAHACLLLSKPFWDKDNRSELQLSKPFESETSCSRGGASSEKNKVGFRL